MFIRYLCRCPDLGISTIQQTTMRFYVSFAVAFLLATARLSAQVLTATPTFPTADDSVTLIYDATQGNAALASYTGDIYAHGGVITNLSTSSSDWKYVKYGWTTNNASMKLTALGAGKYQLKIKPSVRSFYGVPAAETILKMAFVFRSSNGSIVGRNADGSDIFYDVYTNSLTAEIQTPTSGLLVLPGDQVAITGASSAAATLTLSISGNQVATASAATTISHTWTTTTAGTYWIKLAATDGTQTVYDSVSVTVRGATTVATPPAPLKDGINYLSSTSVALQLFAPQKSFVYAIGDFSNWLPNNAYQMQRSSADTTRWWVEIPVVAGQEYAFQYLVNGTLKIADAYCEKVLDPWNDQYISATTYPNLKAYPTGKTQGIVSVFQTNQTPYTWQTIGYQRPEHKNLIVYELLIRDFLAKQNFQTMLDTIPYLKKLGVNCIHLMPFMEFEGNLSWGYNPAFFFAPDKYYGPKNAVKAFVDECHAQGIAVVLDMVLNHAFGSCPLVQLYWDAANNKPATNSPWFNPDAKHPFNVGYDFNHEAPATKAFVDRVLRYWVQEYKLDGFRFDLSKGFTQKNTGSDVGAWSAYDGSRLAILKRMCDSIRVVDPNVIMIMEHLGDNQEEKEMADYGMMPWGKMTTQWNEATMGWIANSDVSWSSWKTRGWNQPNLLAYMESHDEERLMYKNLAFGNSNNSSHNVKTLSTALARMEAAANLFFATPGPKMMWQFAELGYDKSIFMCNNGTLPTPYGNDQCKLDSKPPVWQYTTDPNRQKLYKVHSAIIKLHTTEPAFSSSNFTLNGAGAVKNVSITHSDMNVLAFSNFNVTSVATATLPFPSDGKYYEFWSGDSIQVSGGNFTFNNINPGEYRLYSTKKLAKPDLSVGVVAELPAGLVQAVAYPNPANDRLTIAFNLPQTATVSLEIFSFTGARVATLATNDLRTEGEQTFELNTANLPAGAYFYRLTVDGQPLSGKFSVQP